MAHYLTTAEVADRYRTAASTVRYWRQIGKGPRGVKIGKRVLYPEAELLRTSRRWLTASTSGAWPHEAQPVQDIAKAPGEPPPRA